MRTARMKRFRNSSPSATYCWAKPPSRGWKVFHFRTLKHHDRWAYRYGSGCRSLTVRVKAFQHAESLDIVELGFDILEFLGVSAHQLGAFKAQLVPRVLNIRRSDLVPHRSAPPNEAKINL